MGFTCGVDRRPLLPVLLVTSTVIGALTMLMLQFPLAREYFKGAYGIRAAFLLLYVATLGTMAYCALADPGQMLRVDRAKAYSHLQVDDAEEPPQPKRSHKSWLYRLPVHRYDHYCRWVTNVIGLLNHREFLIMCIGLVSLGGFGAALDL